MRGSVTEIEVDQVNLGRSPAISPLRRVAFHSIQATLIYIETGPAQAGPKLVEK